MTPHLRGFFICVFLESACGKSPTTVRWLQRRIKITELKKINNKKPEPVYVKALAKRKDGRILPLWFHAVDTMETARIIYNRWLPSPLKEDLEARFPQFLELLLFAAGSHDIGKLSAPFQKMLCPERKDFQKFPFYIPERLLGSAPVHHSTLGEIALRKVWEKHPSRFGIASVIGSHHGKFQRFEDLNHYALCNIQPQWVDEWNEFLDEMQKLSGLTSFEGVENLTEADLMILTGLIILSDWTASDEERFPLFDEDEEQERNINLERISRGTENLPFSEHWTSLNSITNEEEFYKRFGFTPNSMQKLVLEESLKLKEEGLLIIEDQMGSGKTEAALAAASNISSLQKCSGIVFALPSQASSNGLFNRIYKWGEQEAAENSLSMKLAHSKASLVEAMQSLPKRSGQMDQDDPQKGLVADEWLSGPRKSLLNDFVVCTIDQVLWMASSVKLTPLSHLGLKGKVVIFDEVHGFDCYTGAFLSQTLTWLAIHKVPVILLSATLTPQRRMELTDAYNEGVRIRTGSKKKNRAKNLPETNLIKSWNYPLVTTSTDNVDSVTYSNYPSREICVKSLPDQEWMNLSIRLLKDHLQQGGSAAVILNSVDKVQAFAKEVQEQYPEADYIVYHSRFTDFGRQDIEEKLFQALKDSEKMEKPLVIIGSQVLQESLDYSVDFMISELAPADLLFQRMGRLHRKKKSLPPKLQKAEFVIVRNDQFKSRIYDKALLRQSAKVLKQTTVISLPEDIPRILELVQNGLETDAAGASLNVLMKNAASRAKPYLLKTKPEKEDGVQVLHDLVQSGAGINSAKVNVVREGDMGTEVYLLKRNQEGKFSFIADKENYLDPEKLIEKRNLKHLAGSRIRLPGWIFEGEQGVDYSMLEISGKELKKIWKDHGLNLIDPVVVLDENGFVKIGRFSISYSVSSGAKISRQEEGEWK